MEGKNNQKLMKVQCWQLPVDTNTMQGQHEFPSHETYDNAATSIMKYESNLRLITNDVYAARVDESDDTIRVVT